MTVAMAGLGIGSLFFCVALYRSRLVPRFLAVWGLVGYGAAGLISTIPGGTGGHPIPHYPGLNSEPITEFLPRVLANHRFDEQTVLVGHSGGAALLLAVLEHIEVTVAQAVLVAGYSAPPNTSSEPVLQESYDWGAIRSHARDLYFVNSVVDPYGCDAAQGRAMFDRLGGTLIVRDDGHFGDHDQAYPTFELLDRLID